MECAVTFLSEANGGRKAPPVLNGGIFRPGTVIGDPSQRRAILDEHNHDTQAHFGITFESGPRVVPRDAEFIATAFLTFYPGVDYKEYVPGATFTMREGHKVVGFGTIKRVWDTQE